MLKYNKEALFVFHDAFLSESSVWNDTFDEKDYDISKIVLDTHKYHAWDAPTYTVEGFC